MRQTLREILNLRYMKCLLAAVTTLLLRILASAATKLWMADNARVLAMEKNVLQVFLLKLCSVEHGF